MQRAQTVQDAPFERFVCWKSERISAVINKEAVSVDKANFLATHAPLNYIRYERAPREMPDASEEALLAELRNRGNDDLHTFMVVLGIPGTGKSHLIRWLKERYDAINEETRGRDVVLLIERAQGTLRGTLEQIINSGVFDSSEMADQVEKLRGAATELSKSALADTILDQLRVATNEVQLPEVDRPPVRIKRNVEKFLLDYTIREELKRPGGPVDRLIRFLTGGTRGVVGDELPGFEPSDFSLSFSTLRQIREQGYQEAKELAEDLRNKEELRVQMARYLNRLLNYAIGHTTALTAEDLKAMFYDLRRHLKSQGRQLALFIEDITAFTGIDAGLVDILATQHTGEGNRDLCRLVSVIGITNGYYDAQFPDNMKERVTHRLSLNAYQEGGVSVESQMLRDPNAIAGLAARYMNAMRLSQEVLDGWLARGAHPEDLPNACFECPFRATCHAAFDSVQVGVEGDERLQLGLYPFNARALSTMYNSISGTSRTPRSLLTSVIEYVMQSHGHKVAQGTFPPSANMLGSDFTPPPLLKPIHLNTINNQAGADARRVESLVRAWGNRTVDSVQVDGHRFVGELAEEVYRAFSLPFIEGEPIDGYGQAQQTPSSGAQAGAVIGVAPDGTVSTPAQSTPVAPSLGGAMPTVTVPPVREPSALAVDISSWASGGRLESYERIADLLANLIRSYVDWEARGISAEQLNDRVRPRHIVIQDQAGKPSSADYIFFERSDRLVATLQALADLSEDEAAALEGPTIAGHLANLSNWLDREEERIVEFVRRPSAKVPEPLPLHKLLLYDCLLLEALAGNLHPERRSSRELLLDLVKSSVRLPSWDEETRKAEEVRSLTWTSLMRNIGKRAETCRKQLLVTLNRAQGDMLAALNRTHDDSRVRFIDAAWALDVLDELQRDWSLERLPSLGDYQAKAWSEPFEVYNSLHSRFPTVLSAERQALDELREELERFTGNVRPQDVFEAMDALLADLRRYQHGHLLTLRSELTPELLERLLPALRGILAEKEVGQRVVKVSGATQIIQRLRLYLRQFQDFCQMVEVKETQLQRQLAEAGINAQITQLRDQVDRNYEAIEGVLTSAASEAYEPPPTPPARGSSSGGGKR